MGIFFRKTRSIGPLRFSLSKTGLSASTGIKGLRFGVGPRGATISAGTNGIYMRKNLTGTPSIARSGEASTQTPDVSLWFALIMAGTLLALLSISIVLIFLFLFS